MRSFLALLACTAITLSAGAQSPEPAANSRVQYGPVVGIAMTGLTVSHPDHTDGVTSVSGNGTSPYIGLFARRSLRPSVHVAAQAVFDLKGDDGAGYSIGYLQFPLQLEFTPFAPRDKATWVRPVFLAGGSAGVRLRGNGGTGFYASLRPFEFSILGGLGVEAHFRTRDWVQLGVVLQSGITDLQPSPGKTTSYSVALFLKAHPGAMKRY